MSALNIRQKILVQAISDARAVRQPLTIAGLAPLLPPDFGLIEADLIELPGFAIEGTMAATETVDELGAPLAAASLSSSPITEADVERAGNKVAEATDALSEARGRVLACQRAELAARDKLASAITQFQIGLDPYSPVDLAHDFAKGETENRRKVAAGEMPDREIPRVANSMIDKMSAGRPGIEHGKWGAWRRGAAPIKPPSAR
jgi:hypothetical protein